MKSLNQLNQTNFEANQSGKNMAKSSQKPHAIMIALPFQGHINPSVNLVMKLASKGCAITFVHTEFIHQMLSKSQNSSSELDLFAEARESGLDIRYTTISDGFPVEFDRFLHSNEYWESMLRDFPARVDEFVGKIIRSDPQSAYFLIADTYYTWPATIARKHNLVDVSFWTEPALVFSIAYHLDLLRENGHFPCKDNIEENLNYIPGVSSINTRDLMPFLKESSRTTMEQKVVVKIFDVDEQVKKADFILQNTVQELEFEAISALNQKQPIYPIGPINFSTGFTKPAISQNLWAQTDTKTWLDSKPSSSVLYVSFGSLVQTSKQIIQEIAHGLLLSKVSFLWVVRSDIVNSNDTDVLPLGFADDIKDQGLIVQWCNQNMVLSHPAIVGFMTHCGWNSVLESIWCGVPMICYPLSSDQPTNRKLVVDDWKIGINLCDGELVTREEVVEKIDNLRSGTISDGLKIEIKKVRTILQKALAVDGSSEKNFDQFIKDLKAKIHVKMQDISTS
ncbi:UDP-glycosyltransferase 86A1-like [Olea europaea var. sylvestris]|uniref:UDP-glycosyltransferase 86A1-like n=1 Tax=Olea europaea var. sylvestris TaxID=158386 RepID=UPI000C1D6C6E|nr:UDP-glycosyltransferase 86A1-like [Olea europaea var. sylvestris]